MIVAAIEMAKVSRGGTPPLSISGRVVAVRERNVLLTIGCGFAALWGMQTIQ
jgi:hypothetical protein